MASPPVRPSVRPSVRPAVALGFFVVSFPESDERRVLVVFLNFRPAEVAFPGGGGRKIRGKGPPEGSAGNPRKIRGLDIPLYLRQKCIKKLL